ncbi:MAG TPA: nucleotidyltransferase family protein [Gemmatimonadales bacterium]|nr:nucleotidyltransferase family protein [Gemmatimonadales bacterium]
MKAGTLLCATLRPDADQRRDELAGAWAAPPPGTAELIRHEGAGLWVHRRLTALGLRDQVEPGMRAVLRQEVMVTAGTNLRVDEEARRTLGLLGDAGIPVILIKGVARRALASRWPLLDARGLGDVDLLLPPDRVQAGWEHLRAAGYDLAIPNSEERYEEHHHLPGLIGPGKVSIELHRSSTINLPPDKAWARFANGSETMAWQGQEVVVPSPTELTWHTISHAATDGVLGFRLRSWMDLVALVVGGAAIDWEVIAHRLEHEAIPDGLTLERVAPSVPRQWLGGAAALVTQDGGGAWGGMMMPVDLVKLLNGRAHLYDVLATSNRFANRILAEWTRGSLDWPAEPVVGSAWRRRKGWLVSHVTRSAARLVIARGAS